MTTLMISPDRLLRLENEVQTLRNRLRWALVGYIILALGVLISLFLLGRNADNIETQTNRLAGAAGAYCAAGLRPDVLENSAIHKLADGQPIKLQRVCVRIVRRLEQ